MTKYHTAIFVDWVSAGEEMYKFGDTFVRFEKITQMLNLYYYELTVETSSLKEALFIIDLIICSFTLIYSEQTILLEDLQNNMIQSVSQELDAGKFTEYHFQNETLLPAVNIAYGAYGDVSKENAIYKYGLARKLIDIHPFDFHPASNFTEPFYLVSTQLMFGYVIIICYSILEELKMEIRATAANPSSINDSWNPQVLNDLKERLTKNDVNPSDKISWLSRNNTKRPFKSAIIKGYALCTWSDKEDVCDFNITICDAILELSFIRDRIASHGVGKRIYDLSIFDVENAYALIRQILHKCFGFNKV